MRTPYKKGSEYKLINTIIFRYTARSEDDNENITCHAHQTDFDRQIIFEQEVSSISKDNDKNNKCHAHESDFDQQITFEQEVSSISIDNNEISSATPTNQILTTKSSLNKR